MPLFDYGELVLLAPCEKVPCRVVDIHFYVQGIQYEVRYFMNGEAKIVRVFEDELLRVGT
jgi:hypothetical protein